MLAGTPVDGAQLLGPEPPPRPVMSLQEADLATVLAGAGFCRAPARFSATDFLLSDDAGLFSAILVCCFGAAVLTAGAPPSRANVAPLPLMERPSAARVWETVIPLTKIVIVSPLQVHVAVGVHIGQVTWVVGRSVPSLGCELSTRR